MAFLILLEHVCVPETSQGFFPSATLKGICLDYHYHPPDRALYAEKDFSPLHLPESHGTLAQVEEMGGSWFVIG